MKKISILATGLLLLGVTQGMAQNHQNDTLKTRLYMMVVYTTRYASVTPGSTIAIHYPGKGEPEIIRPEKKENFRSRLLKELNTLSEKGWEVVHVYNSEYQMSGDSGTTSDESVYLLKQVKY